MYQQVICNNCNIEIIDISQIKDLSFTSPAGLFQGKIIDQISGYCPECKKFMLNNFENKEL
jgi:hypothetical protein